MLAPGLTLEEYFEVFALPRFAFVVTSPPLGYLVIVTPSSSSLSLLSPFLSNTSPPLFSFLASTWVAFSHP